MLGAIDVTDGVTSLREAIFATNLIDGADEIQFDFGHDGPETIVLTMGELVITDSLTITGPGAELLTIDASGNDPTPDENNGDGSRIFNVDDGSFTTVIDVELRGLTLTGGDVLDGGGAIFSIENLSITDNAILGNSARFSNGGGIHAGGTTTITDSVILGNSAVGDGGGMFFGHGATTFIDGSTISDNSASDSGGGVSGSGGGISSLAATITITRSTISGNSATSTGGAVIGFHEFDEPKSSITDSLITNNSSGRYGGGLFIFPGVTITGSTISDNSTKLRGGGVFVTELSDRLTATIVNSTITGNSVNGDGGGVFVETNANLKIDHTIVAKNTSYSFFTKTTTDDIFDFSVSIDARFSLIGDRSGTRLAEAPIGSPDANGNLIGGPIHGIIDPLLGPLADNGGPTPTHALLAGSPAINRGDLNAVAGIDGVPLFDQRGDGFDRVFSGRIDIGAYEIQEFSDLNLLVDTLDDESDGDYSRFDLSLREAIELANANPAADTINFDLTLAGGTILLTMGELAITDSVEIIGLGAELLTIDASGNDPTPDENNGDGSRIFGVNVLAEEGEAAIRQLTLTGGDVSSDGGAIRSTSFLHLSDVAVNSNSARGSGGGVYLRSSQIEFNIESSSFHNNIAFGDGGGVYVRLTNLAASPVFIDSSSFSENQSFRSGGGLFVDAPGSEAVIVDSSFTSNSAQRDGGGLSVSGWSASNDEFSPGSRVTISGSTFLDNQAGDEGGAIHAGQGRPIGASSNYGGGSVSIADSTISGNSAGDDGGGVFAGGGRREAGNVAVTSSDISNNTSGENGGGIFAGGTLELLTGSSIYPAEASRSFRVFSEMLVGYFVASEGESN